MPRAGLDRDAVVSAAAELADADGLGALTLARLADRLGVRAPSLYAHIDGLPDLRRRLAARGAGELTADLQAAAAGRSAGDALLAIAGAYRAYALAHPGTYDALQRAPEVIDPQVQEAARRLVGVVLAVLRGYGLEGDGAIHGARIVRAALHGFVTLETGGGFALPLSLDESFDQLVAVLDRGLAGPRA
jgi:AcrR family transcriptional regulator